MGFRPIGRVSFCSNSVIEHGVKLEQLARILGHSDPQTTLGYIQISEKRLAEMYEVAL